MTRCIRPRYNTAMNWRRIERWATIAIYVSSGLGLAILLAEELAAPGSLAARITAAVAARLMRLGEIGGGLLFAVVLTYLTIIIGVWFMVLLMEGIDRLRNRKYRLERQQAAARAEGQEQARAEGREQGRKEGRAEMEGLVRERLGELGIDLDLDAVLRPPPPAANGADAAISEERVRLIVRECLEQLGVKPQPAPPPAPDHPA